MAEKAPEERLWGCIVQIMLMAFFIYIIGVLLAALFKSASMPDVTPSYRPPATPSWDDMYSSPGPSRSSGATTVSTCTLAPSASAYRQATDAAAHGNGLGVAATGTVILESGTRVRVLGSGGFMLKRVAVLSGPYAGKTGVVASEKIR